MLTEILIRRNYSSSSVAESIKNSIQPDNINIPRDTTIELKLYKTSLMIKVSSKDDLASFLRTVDDLLICLQAAETTIHELGLDDASQTFSDD
ncbi:MAG: KEOPS complex subunit Pcc1 [Candidatus Methanomethyliaceae archaeon]|nr:KEOPS complex subunit Pcc1 [Candidatus Methanomethyliaceae archaeon]